MNNTSPELLREHFYAWQCRIRQIAMRDGEGRPSPGMCPRLSSNEGAVLMEHMTTLIHRGNPEESTEYLKFQVQKSNDPKEVRDKALRYLQSTHYQGSKNFADHIVATFKEGSEFAQNLAKIGSCVLEFSEFNQGFILSCAVEIMDRNDPFFAATLWHNRAFNPLTPDTMVVLNFKPDWLKSEKI